MTLPVLIFGGDFWEPYCHKGAIKVLLGLLRILLGILKALIVKRFRSILSDEKSGVYGAILS